MLSPSTFCCAQQTCFCSDPVCVGCTYSMCRLLHMYDEVDAPQQKWYESVTRCYLSISCSSSTLSMRGGCLRYVRCGRLTSEPSAVQHLNANHRKCRNIQQRRQHNGNKRDSQHKCSRGNGQVHTPYRRRRLRPCKRSCVLVTTFGCRGCLHARCDLRGRRCRLLRWLLRCTVVLVATLRAPVVDRRERCRRAVVARAAPLTRRRPPRPVVRRVRSWSPTVRRRRDGRGRRGRLRDLRRRARGVEAPAPGLRGLRAALRRRRRFASRASRVREGVPAGARPVGSRPPA